MAGETTAPSRMEQSVDVGGALLQLVRRGREPNVHVDDGVCRNTIAMESPFGTPFTGRFCGLSYGMAPRATARVADPACASARLTFLGFLRSSQRLMIGVLS